MCDASKFGIGAVLLQSHSGRNKMNLISANSRLFTQAELRISTLMGETTAIIYTLTEIEFVILGSKHPTVFFTDHKPIIFLSAQKIKPKPKSLQISIDFFMNLYIVWTAGKKSCTTRHTYLKHTTQITNKKNNRRSTTKYYVFPCKGRSIIKTRMQIRKKNDIDQTKINNVQHFPLYFDCQSKYYEVEL